MKILCTSDWHLGNLFHSIDRLPEHKHFLGWLLGQVAAQCPDALLVAGDVFDNGNPSAAAQTAYYDFLAEATAECPDLQVVIIAGNHDSANRLEAPRPLLHRHKVEIRGSVRRKWIADVADEDGHWETDYEDLMIPIYGKEGEKAVVLAVPYLRSDVMMDGSYSKGVNQLLRTLTEKAREKYPDCPLVMMAHLYATGAEFGKNPSERIVIGGQEQVDIDNWDSHPDYFTCGHIHKRQHIWGTDWARYCGNVLPMSFAETGYHHGIDLVTITKGEMPEVEFIEYEPQHRLVTLPTEGAAEWKELKKLIKGLPDREDDKLSDHAVYLELKYLASTVKPEDRKKIEDAVAEKDAVICRLQQVLPDLAGNVLADKEAFSSIDDIQNRKPQDAIRECFLVKKHKELNEHQQQMIEEIVNKVQTTINQDPE